MAHSLVLASARVSSRQLAPARVNLKQLEEETELGDNESFNDLYKKNHEIRSV